MRLKCITNSPSQTKKFAGILARQILKKGPQKRALVLGLIGDLGGGKTTFLQGFAKGLGIRNKILSPTFVILKSFEISNSNLKNFYHFDCYRTENPKDILNLGFSDILKNPKNIVAIEWADKIKKILPRKQIILEFDFVDKTKRSISLLNCG